MMISSIISQNAVCIHHILTRKPKDSTWEERENWGKDRAKVKLLHFGLLAFWWRKHLSLTWLKERHFKWNLPQSMQLGRWSLYRYTYEWMCWNVTRLESFFVGGGKKNATKNFLSMSALKQTGIYHAWIGVEFQSPPEHFRETQLCTPGEL